MLRRLDLDHVGAEVGQQHAGEWAGHDLADVENADAFEGEFLGGHGFFFL
jgi:hypothetical protein